MNLTKDRGRITARVPLNVEETLNEAADLSGATLSHFVVQAALEKAQAIIDRERTIRFTSKDAALLINMLDAPFKPNQALTRAFKRYNDKGTNEKSLSSVNKGSRP
jgi:uncharacterized protein (DUF1778 family)